MNDSMSDNDAVDETIICRCEDLTLAEIKKAIDEHGLRSFDEVKRITRCGMGPCQGKSCRKMVERMLAKKTGKSVSALEHTTFRQPTKPVDIKVLAEAWEDEKKE